MTDIEVHRVRPVETEGDKRQVASLRGPRPILVWSSIGAVFIAIACYAYGSWIVSGNATPVSPGPDPLPRITTLAMTAFQIVSPMLAIVAIVYVTRKSIRDRQLCLEAAIVIGGAIEWWHDPLINWLQPVLFYNAAMVNFGNWMGDLPGVLAPDAGVMAEPVLMLGAVYVWMPLAMGLVARGAMARARKRWPGLGPVRTFCCGWAAVFALEASLELIAVHTGLVGYPAAPPELTLWAGQTVQLPIYGPILWSLVLTSTGALLFFRDRNGRVLVERGIETLNWAGNRTRAVLRVLAVAGFMHVVAIGVYDTAVNFAGLYAGPTETYPSYMRTQFCGPETPRACPNGTRFDDPAQPMR